MGTEDGRPERTEDHDGADEYLRRRRALLPASIGDDGPSDQLAAVADPAVLTVPTQPSSSPKEDRVRIAAPTAERGPGTRGRVSGRKLAVVA